MSAPQPRPEMPVRPADVTYPRRALSRLALSAAAAELSDVAASVVPTVSDDYSNAYETMSMASRLMHQARDVMARSVVHALEQGSWDDVAEALDISAEEAKERYGEEVTRWQQALDEPYDRELWDQPFTLPCRLPTGAGDPEWYSKHLDEWCAQRHTEQSSAVYQLAKGDGISDRMVSANLAKHSTLSEWNVVQRWRRRLRDTRAPEDGPEWQALREREAVVKARIDAETAAMTKPAKRRTRKAATR